MEMIYINVALIGVSAYLAGAFEYPLVKALNVFASAVNMGVVIAFIAA